MKLSTLFAASQWGFESHPITSASLEKLCADLWTSLYKAYFADNELNKIRGLGVLIKIPRL